MDFDDVAKQLNQIDKKITTAVQAVERDERASPALQAVVKEFERKAHKAVADLDEAKEPVREHIVELEQAGDSAKRAASAEREISDTTRQVVLDAHTDVCKLKADTAA